MEKKNDTEGENDNEGSPAGDADGDTDGGVFLLACYAAQRHLTGGRPGSSSGYESSRTSSASCSDDSILFGFAQR